MEGATVQSVFGILFKLLPTSNGQKDNNDLHISVCGEEEDYDLYDMFRMQESSIRQKEAH